MKSKKLKSIIILNCFVALVLYSCATIIDGKYQSIVFNSSPSGAEIMINGASRGVTPLTVTLERSQDDKVAIARKDGYEDHQFLLVSKMNMWFLGNILTGGLTGSTTDYISHAAFEYEPGMYAITLNPKNASELEKSNIRKNMWARNFILASYSHLAVDLARGEGEYLSSLYSVLGVDDGAQNEALQELRWLSFKKNRDTWLFSEAVMQNLYSSGSS